VITSDFPKTEAFVGALVEHRLLTPSQLEHVNRWRLAFPGGSTAELANYLVQEQILTRFQADVILEEDPKRLSLSVYTLVDVIGTGSLGTVYKARSSKDDGWYAVKVVPRRNVINLKSIGEKVEALKQVRHPRVSAMVHVGASGERAYLVWPMLEGGEKLDAAVKRLGRLAPRQAAQVALQIASGLQAYHDHDLFHGLLKASDVIIGSDRRVRLLDFGVGFLLTCDRGKALLDTMTNSKALARGLDCASPEAIMDPLNRTVLGDQYSLGCILYFCLAGHYPFPENNPVKKMLAHQCHEPTPIRQIVPDCPAKLASIVHRLLRKQPEERYNSIGDLIADLQAITSDGKRGVTPSRPSAIIDPPSKRPPQSDVESPAEPAETNKKNSQVATLLTMAGMVAGGLVGLAAWWLAHR
jgi:serine/threonine-protein kinase